MTGCTNPTDMLIHKAAGCMTASSCADKLLYSVRCLQTSDGRPTGEAFVELKDEPSQAEAMKRHKMLMVGVTE